MISGCIIVVSMYVSSPYVWSVMWCPLDSVTTCCIVHFTIAPSYFLHGLTVCPWVLIDFVTFGPKLLLQVQEARKVLENFVTFCGDLNTRPHCWQASTLPTVLCLFDEFEQTFCILIMELIAHALATATGKHGSVLRMELVMYEP